MTWVNPVFTLSFLLVFTWFCLYKFEYILCLIPFYIMTVMIGIISPT